MDTRLKAVSIPFSFKTICRNKLLSFYCRPAARIDDHRKFDVWITGFVIAMRKPLVEEVGDQRQHGKNDRHHAVIWASVVWQEDNI
jgi:hypothetical protein